MNEQPVQEPVQPVQESVQPTAQAEQVLLEVKPSWKCLIPHFILMFIVIGFLTIWKPLISMLTTKLTITNKMVSGKTGLIKTESMDSPIKQVTSVKVEQGLFGKLLNYGTIHINTASGNYSFGYITDAEKVKTLILNNLQQ